jgi:hypothetical protein
MIRFLSVMFLLLSSVPAYAMPQFLQLFRSDPFRNPSVDGCITCHMSAQGGDARNAFGQAFESGGEQITPLLRAQFPDRFVYPISRVSDALTIHFSDPDKKQIVVEAGGMKNLVDVDRRTVNGTPATNTTSPVRVAIPSGQDVAGAASEVPVDPYAREGAFFGANVVNLPNGKPQKGGGLDFFIGHRFAQDVKNSGFGRLFGFDSGANIAYGVRAGLTDRLSVSAYRTSLALAQTISLGSSFQISRQSVNMPLTVQVRGSVDGKHNFGLYRKENENNRRLPERQYSPVLQVVTTRTFKDRVSFVMVPTFAWNTRDENNGEDIPGSSYGTQYNSTIALGLGGGVRFLPSVSLVGEIIPRWRYRGLAGGDSYKDMPGFSIGLQKSTFRHTFELLISRQLSMTPAQVATQGNDRFRVGFNIYRKLR